jgi:hypothetical protein
LLATPSAWSWVIVPSLASPFRACFSVLTRELGAALSAVAAYDTAGATSAAPATPDSPSAPASA